MKKRQAISVSMMIALGVLMANGAIADAQSKKDASRRLHDNPANKTAPNRIDAGRNTSERIARQRLSVIKRAED